MKKPKIKNRITVEQLFDDLIEVAILVKKINRTIAKKRKEGKIVPQNRPDIIDLGKNDYHIY